jgi:hypothetical protein
MDAQEDAQLRLAAFRHPAARVVGSLHQAQLRLDEAARAFLTVMAAAGDPGAGPLPAPGGRTRWPRGHGARHVQAWLLPVPGDDGFQCWLDTTGQWWTVRFDGDGSALDAHPVGDPLRAAAELGAYRDAFEQLLVAGRVPH